MALPQASPGFLGRDCVNFDLTTPCKDCPFRTDIKPFLTKARAREIFNAITRKQQTFSCHKTVAYADDDDESDSYVPSTKEQHCAGALILLEKLEMPNQLMRISERFGGYDRNKLKMDAPVFDSGPAFVKAQQR